MALVSQLFLAVVTILSLTLGIQFAGVKVDEIAVAEETWLTIPENLRLTWKINRKESDTTYLRLINVMRHRSGQLSLQSMQALQRHCHPSTALF